MKKRVFSRSILVLSLLFANVLVVNKYSDKKIVFADEFSGWKQEGNERYFYQKGKKFTGEFEGKYYYEGKFATGWFNNGTAWYYFKEGIKHTGKGKDANGEMYFVNGKYANGYVGDIYYYEGKVANWWFKDGSEWHFFQNGKRHTGYAKDGNGRRYFANGKYANGIYEGKLFKDGVESKGKVYANDIFYDENSKPANGWYDDGSAWYYFKNGKKHNGKAKDGNGEMYFVNGKYANGYVNSSFYKDGKVVTGWYDDGSAWYYFKNGEKHTGYAVDGNGEMYFVKGKYANAYIDGIFYGEGKIANWWYDDGTAWYFFINGKKFTGNGVDGNGKRLFDNGKYANGIYEGKLYKDGVVSKGKVYAKGIFYDENSKPATGWYDDGSAWYYFKDGYKYTGKAKDGNGEMQFINGKYANGRYDNKLYKEGLESNGNTYISGQYYDGSKYPASGWYDDGSEWYYFIDGYKYTGYATDGNGRRYFVNGKYANGWYGGTSYMDGVETELADSNWYVQNGIWRVKDSGRSCHVNGNFIVVSLSDQTLWLVRNGQIISKIGIVSGKPSSPTVTGNFSVQSRETSRILRGPGYASRVSYWMPFYGSYGIHDANWQPYSAFSNSNYYRWGGSHGCVNVSPESMGYIFNNSFVEMRVIVY